MGRTRLPSGFKEENAGGLASETGEERAAAIGKTDAEAILAINRRREGLSITLFGARSEDFFTLNLNFNAERRTEIGALYYGSADPDVSGKIGQTQRIKKGVVAGI